MERIVSSGRSRSTKGHGEGNLGTCTGDARACHRHHLRKFAGPSVRVFGRVCLVCLGRECPPGIVPCDFIRPALTLMLRKNRFESQQPWPYRFGRRRRFGNREVTRTWHGFRPSLKQYLELRGELALAGQGWRRPQQRQRRHPSSSRRHWRESKWCILWSACVGARNRFGCHSESIARQSSMHYTPSPHSASRS